MACAHLTCTGKPDKARDEFVVTCSGCGYRKVFATDRASRFARHADWLEQQGRTAEANELRGRPVLSPRSVK